MNNNPSGKEGETEKSMEVDEINTDTDDNAQETLPWTALGPFYDKVAKKDALNYTARCTKCKKMYSCSVSSASNLEKHLVSRPKAKFC